MGWKFFLYLLGTFVIGLPVFGFIQYFLLWRWLLKKEEESDTELKELENQRDRLVQKLERTLGTIDVPNTQ